MSIHPGSPTQARRPFIGFDLEAATYARIKPEWLSRSPGKFVAIVGDEVEGPAETFEEALAPATAGSASARCSSSRSWPSSRSSK